MLLQLYRILLSSIISKTAGTAHVGTSAALDIRNQIVEKSVITYGVKNS